MTDYYITARTPCDRDLDKLAEQILTYSPQDAVHVVPKGEYREDGFEICDMAQLQELVREWQVFRARLEPFRELSKALHHKWTNDSP